MEIGAEKEFILKMVVRKALTLQLVWSSDLKEVNKGAIWKENIPDRVTASAKARR